MFETVTERINRKITAEARLNEGEMIQKLITDDFMDPRKRKMLEGERYYCCEQDILNKDFTRTFISETEYGPQGEERERVVPFQNPNRSNERIASPFHKILVDQKVSYLVGREPTISVKGAEKEEKRKEYEKLLASFAGEEFNETLQNMVTGASNNGYQVLHFYYGKNGALRYTIIPARECILIYDTQYEDTLEQVIRYYDITVTSHGEKQIRKKVEWWTQKDVTYYTQTEEGAFVLDNAYACNPSPHWWETEDLEGYRKKREAHGWGRVPFIILKNNEKGTTDLEPVKGLIDAYDLVISEGTNNLIDLVDLYWVIAGYGGETASAVMRKLQMNKAVNISDSSGSIEARQISIPVEGRLSWLKMLRKDIFRFGQGIDIDEQQFGTAPSGVSLKFQYTFLDLKANAMVSKIKGAIKEFFWFMTEDYNRRNGTDFQSEWIHIDINKTMITNDLEMVNMIQMSENIVSEKTLLGKHPLIDDVNEEMRQIAEQRRQKEKEVSHTMAKEGEKQRIEERTKK